MQEAIAALEEETFEEHHQNGNNEHKPLKRGRWRSLRKRTLVTVGVLMGAAVGHLAGSIGATKAKLR